MNEAKPKNSGIMKERIIVYSAQVNWITRSMAEFVEISLLLSSQVACSFGGSEASLTNTNACAFKAQPIAIRSKVSSFISNVNCQTLAEFLFTNLLGLQKRQPDVFNLCLDDSSMFDQPDIARLDVTSKIHAWDIEFNIRREIPYLRAPFILSNITCCDG